MPDADLLAGHDEELPGRPLLQPVMRGGECVGSVTESILMSLPPHVEWHYARRPAPGNAATQTRAPDLAPSGRPSVCGADRTGLPPSA